MYLYLSQAIHKREDHQQQQQHEKTPFISNKINDTRRQKGTGSDRTEPSLRVLLLLLLLLLADDMIIIIIMIHREMHDRRLDRWWLQRRGRHITKYVTITFVDRSSSDVSRCSTMGGYGTGHDSESSVLGKDLTSKYNHTEGTSINPEITLKCQWSIIIITTTDGTRNRSPIVHQLLKYPTNHVMIPIIALTYIVALQQCMEENLINYTAQEFHYKPLTWQQWSGTESRPSEKELHERATWWVCPSKHLVDHFGIRPQLIGHQPGISLLPTDLICGVPENVMAIFVIVRVRQSSSPIFSSSLVARQLTHFSIKPNQLSLLRAIRTVPSVPSWLELELEWSSESIILLACWSPHLRLVLCYVARHNIISNVDCSAIQLICAPTRLTVIMAKIYLAIIVVVVSVECLSGVSVSLIVI